MSALRANTLKDNCNFFLHFGLAATVTTGAFVALGCPLVLGGIAVATTAGLQLGLTPLIKGMFQEAIDDEKKDSLKTTNRDFFTPSSKAAHYYEKMRQKMVEGWTAKFAHAFGLKDEPGVLIMPPAHPLDAIRNINADKGLRGFLRGEFNKHANAFAFAHEQRGNVVLTNPIVETLDERELQGVVAHEVGHLAAGHTDRQMAISAVAGPARILTGLNKLITSVISLKNFGLVYGAGVISNIAVEQIANMQHLNKEEPKDAAKLSTYKRYINSAAVAGLAVLFQAPDLLIAEGLSFATREGLNLIQKRYSRRNEFQADRLAAEVTRDPEGLSLGLEKIRDRKLKSEPGFNPEAPDTKGKDPLSKLFRQMGDMRATHPNIDRRTERLRSMDIPMSAWQPS